LHYNASVGSIPMCCILLDFLVIEFSANESFECKTVFTEFTACRFAGKPTKRSPCFVNATTDGVVRAPSAFSITRDVLPSMIETHEFVVPKSIPTTGPATRSQTSMNKSQRGTHR